MAEISIDQSKLPGVKEVCRDFAVLEDHTLAHSLQEQEIEHHLATNVQRNRLVQHDLQVAKQLQEEEDRRARTQIQKRHKDIERQDCEIAQEIQVKLVIEAEQRRRQEEKDEDIARILQQKELQEEKKRKKHHPDPPGLPMQEDSYYAENGGHPRGRSREQVSEHTRPRRAQSGDRRACEQRDPQRASLALSDNTTEHQHPAPQSSPQQSKTRDGQQRSRERWKPASQERPQRPPSLNVDRTADCAAWDWSSSSERKPQSWEKSRRPPSLDLDTPNDDQARERPKRNPASRENPRRPPRLDPDAPNDDQAREQPERNPASREKSRRPPSLDLDTPNDDQAREQPERNPASREKSRRPPSLDLNTPNDDQAREQPERSPASRENPRRPPSLDLDTPNDDQAREQPERSPASQENPRRPPSRDAGPEAGRATWEHKESKPLSQERPRRPPALQLDLESDPGAWGHSRGQQKREKKPLGKARPRPAPSPDLEAAWEPSRSPLSNPENPRSRRHDRLSPGGACDARLREAEELPRHEPRRGEERDYHRAGHGPSTSPSPHTESWDKDRDRLRDPGMRLRGTKEAVYAKPRVAFRDQELSDAEIARKLQDEELLANQVDPRAAQVAQDEEIARLLMAEEKKAYKKTKEREKSSSEKKRQDQEWRQDPSESARPRSRDRHEPQRPKSDRPARPPPPSVAGVDDFDHSRGFASPPSSVRQFSKPESSPKGFHYKQ